MRAGLSGEQVKELATELRRAGYAEEAANLMRVDRAAVQARSLVSERVPRAPAAAELRFSRPGERRIERYEIRATGTPIERAPRDLARATRGKDIEIRRATPEARREETTMREPPRIEARTRTEILTGRTTAPRGESPRTETPRTETARGAERTTSTRETTRIPETRTEIPRGEVRRTDIHPVPVRAEGHEGKGRIKLGGEPQREFSKGDLESAAAYSAGMGIWAIRKPGEPDDWKFFMRNEAPPELKVTDRRTAYDTIRLWRGEKGFSTTRDMGIVDVTISNPKKTPGAPGAISFQLDRSNWAKRPRMPSRRPATPKMKARLSRDVYSRGGMISHLKTRRSKRVSRGGVIRG